MDESTLARVERQRKELEENLSKLRKSLRHWQTLEIDYEGLKEEFQGLPEDSTYDECFKTAEDFKPELVNEKELQDLIGKKQHGHRRPSQIVGLLSNRVDYVNKNVTTIRKQLSEAEKKRNAILLAQDPEHQNDAGLPLSEITEELDEDGKVIASKVQAPGQEAPDLLEVLRKAGVPEVNDGNTLDAVVSETKHKNIDTSSIGSSSRSASTTGFSSSTSAGSKHDEEDAEDEVRTSDAARLEPTNPGDTEEDAALRQEMLQYGLGEVNAIVAELDLHDSADFSFDEDEEDGYVSDFDEDQDLYTDESEDEKGATKNPVISERYKRQMEALSKKHGITDLKNLGPKPELPDDTTNDVDRPSAAEAARRAAIARHEVSKSSLKSSDKEDKSGAGTKKKKKKVGFAAELDIADETPKPHTSTAATEPTVNPVGELVVERTTGQNENVASNAPSLSVQTANKKTSRFKEARTSAPQTPMFAPPMTLPTSNPIPSGPPGKTISSTLIERPAPKTTIAPDPNDIDEEMHRKEVALEFQKMRNRKIHEQGGYVQGGQAENYGEDTALIPDVDETTGEQKKVSRFKAARMKS